MKKARMTLILLFWIFLALPVFSLQEKAAAAQPKPIELQDILAWKSIRTAALSNDGQWFGYRLSPNKGDGEVITRKTKGAIQNFIKILGITSQ